MTIEIPTLPTIEPECGRSHPGVGLYNLGYTVSDVAEQFGVDTMTMHKRLVLAGYSPRKTGERTELKLEERFWNRVAIRSGCWEWLGPRNKAGYGSLQWLNESTNSHRVAYKLANGEIPAGLYVRHKCDNPPCCNPTHLFLGTCSDNAQDMVAKGRARKGKRR